jgi:hypothetical protein
MRRSRRIFCVQRWDNRKILYSLCGAFILGYSLLLSEFLWLTNAPGTNSTLMDFAYHLNLRENDFFALIKEIEHLNKLHEACMRFNDSIIPWKYGINENYTEVWNKTSPQLVEYLKECPEIEILQAAHLRGHGYCQDSSVYVKCKYLLFTLCNKIN